MACRLQFGFLALALVSLLPSSATAGSARRTEPDLRPSQHAAQNTLRAEEGEALVDVAVGEAADLMGAVEGAADLRAEPEATGASALSVGEEHSSGLRNKRRQPDCSHFVHLVYSDAGLGYKYQSSRDLYRGVPEFTRVKKPQAGDLIVWPGHVGIVVSRKEKTFFSSVNSGIITESWMAAHWIARGRPRFYRYRVTEETDLSLLASAGGNTYNGDTKARRKANSYRGLTQMNADQE